MGQPVKDRLVVTNDTKHLMVVREFVGRMVRLGSIVRDAENKIILAVDEAVTNIMEHGYDPGVEGTIEIEIETDDRHFKVVIRDNGRIFNPETVPNFDIQKHLKSGKKGGLGLFLMRQIMDEVRYRFEGGVRNELTLVKFTK